jgi:hypothetical protein
MQERSRTWPIVGVAVVAALLLVACGGSANDAATETGTAAGESDHLPTATSHASTATASNTRDVTPTLSNERPRATTTEAAQAESPTSEPTPMGPTPTIPPVPTKVPPPPPVTLTGTGAGTTDSVDFPTGVAVVTMNHSGQGQFRVFLRNPDQSIDRLVGSGKGTWKGSTGLDINSAGSYTFSVEADGDWQVDVLWPTPETAPVAEVPFEYSGTGDQAVYFVIVRTGVHSVSIDHDGDGNYSVETMSSEGRRYIDKFHGTGRSSATQQFEVRDKAFEFLLFNIEASGNWTIRVE